MNFKRASVSGIGRSIAGIQIPFRSRVCVKIRRSYSMYGSIEESFSLLPPAFTRWILRHRDIASTAFQISPGDVFYAVTYIPRCVGFSKREGERGEGSAAMTTTGTKYITCFPLKKQI